MCFSYIYIFTINYEINNIKNNSGQIYLKDNSTFPNDTYNDIIQK